MLIWVRFSLENRSEDVFSTNINLIIISFFILVDLSLIEKYRSEMPLFDHRRSDVYDLVYKKAESNQN